MNELIEIEGLDVEDKAVRYIARMADGGMRDALSLLDQCVAFYIGERLTYDRVLEVLGAVDVDVFSRIFKELVARDVKGVIETLDELIMQGRELSQLAADFTWYLRNLLLLKSSENMEDVLDVSTENLVRMKEEAELIEMDELIRYIRIFSDLTNQLKFSSQKRVLLEVTFIKLCRPQMESGPDALLSRIRALEAEVEKGLSAPQTERVVYRKAVEEKPVGPKPELPKALSEDIRNVAKNFRSIADNASMMLKQYLKQARLSAGENDRLLIVLPDEVSAGFVAKPEHKEEIIHLIEEKIGKTMEIDVRHVEEGRHFEDSFVDIQKMIHMDITIED